MYLFSWIHDLLILQPTDGRHATTYENDDVLPLNPARRTWGLWQFACFWSINNLVPTTFMAGSSLIGTGLSVRQAMIAVFIAKLITAAVAVLNGYVGAQWHIPFPVISRYVWGVFGNYLIVYQRIILACLWMACQSWTGGLCVSVVLSSIFPAYHRMQNSMPKRTHMETKQFLGWITFNVISCFLLWIPPEKCRRLFYVAQSISLAAMIGIMSYTVSKAHGVGPLLSESAEITKTHSVAWAIVRGVTSVLGSIAVGLTNQPDYSRFATRVSDQVVGQLISIPVFGTLTPFLGCITASATQDLYGEAMWDPSTVVSKWLTTNYTPGSRAAAVFIGTGLTGAQLAINTIDNGFSGGMDLAGMFPKYINIRRGSYLTLCVSVLLQPWHLFRSASMFVAVLSAYSCLLGPLIGIMIIDFWVVRRRKIKLSNLYTVERSGIYYFWHGFNLRAYFAWICGFAPILPGLIASLSHSVKVPLVATYVYYLAFPLGFLVSGTTFYLTCSVWQPRGLGEIDDYDDYESFTAAECRRLGMCRTASGRPEGETGQGSASSCKVLAIPEMFCLTELRSPR